MTQKKSIMLIVIIVAVLAGAIFLFLRSIKKPAAEKINSTVPMTTAKPSYADRTEAMKNLLAQKYTWPVDKVEVAIAAESSDGCFIKGVFTLYEKTGQIVKVDDKDVEMPKINQQGLFLATKKGSNWEIAWSGNGNYDCETTAKYQFPTDLVSDCEKSPAQQ